MNPRLSIDVIYSPDKSAGSITFTDKDKKDTVIYECDPDAAKCIYFALMAMKENGVDPLSCNISLVVTNA